jgi:hypothetical protein
MATTLRTRIYAREEVIFAKLVCQTVGGQFFSFLPKLDGCQVDLPNFWSCFNNKLITDENGMSF